MAYIRNVINPVCLCGRPATYEVFTESNESIGKFCRHHADWQASIAQTMEDRKAEDARREGLKRRREEEKGRIKRVW